MEWILVAVAVLGLAGVGFWFLRPDGMRYPKCLVCSNRLNMLGSTKIVTCTQCRIAYSRTTIEEAEPRVWEMIRQERLFSLAFRRDTRTQHILLEVSLSASKIENTVKEPSA